jgi:hypothetical protein
LISVRGGRTGSFCADEGARVSDAVEPAKMRPSARRLKLIRAKIQAVSLMTFFRSNIRISFSVSQKRPASSAAEPSHTIAELMLFVVLNLLLILWAYLKFTRQQRTVRRCAAQKLHLLFEVR